jgi:hypothetical protein
MRFRCRNSKSPGIKTFEKGAGKMLEVLFADYGPGIKYLIATLAIIAIVLAICVCDTNGVIYSAFTNLIASFLTRANALAGF